MTYLSIEDSSCFDGVRAAAEHEARRHFIVVNTLDLDLDILSAGDRCHLNVVRPDLLHLNLRLEETKYSDQKFMIGGWFYLVRHHQQCLPLLTGPTLNLSYHHCAHITVSAMEKHHEKDDQLC